MLSNVSGIIVVSNINNEITFKLDSIDYNIQIIADENSGITVKNSNGYVYGIVKFEDISMVYMTYNEKSFSLIGESSDDELNISIMSIGEINNCTYFISSIDTIKHFKTVVYCNDNVVWSSEDDTCYCNVFDNAYTYAIKIPKYLNLVTSNQSVNSLNNISLILPCYIYIRESPASLNVWKYFGSISSIGSVSMYNMSNYNIAQSSYDRTGDKYICCELYKRRTLGYAGIAIKLTNRIDITEDDTSGIPNIQ